MVLVSAYPSSAQIQAIFFWNPWIRRLSGLGYVGLALTWIPYLRRKLFIPFRESLLADADIGSLEVQPYFDEARVRLKDSEDAQLLKKAIPGIKGRILLEGESGLGKTMFLRHLVKGSRDLIVFLQADQCSGGVLEAIQAKLHGPAKDSHFLRDLIYSGAINICIDGLNEVTADTRAKVVEFVTSYFKGNIIMATQPLEWEPPSTVKTYVMEPLTSDQIERFLVTCSPGPDDARVAGSGYLEASRRYLAEALSPKQSHELLSWTTAILSNPMDLSVVAHLIADGQQPDVFTLQEQQYHAMADDYRHVNLGEGFPLRAFSETVYEMRLQNDAVLPSERYAHELQTMARYKMVLNRQSTDLTGRHTTEWRFRHEKIRDFFIVQTFLGKENERAKLHLNDSRFRGVYFLLATLLPYDDASELREYLIQNAADTKDHAVSDTFVQLLRLRRAA